MANVILLQEDNTFDSDNNSE